MKGAGNEHEVGGLLGCVLQLLNIQEELGCSLYSC
jgi:hypothetical protein